MRQCAPLLLSDAVSPLQVVWTGHVVGRLPAVEVIATADIREIRSRIAIGTAARPGRIPEVRVAGLVTNG